MITFIISLILITNQNHLKGFQNKETADYYAKIIFKHCYNYTMVFKSIKHTIKNLVAETPYSIIESSNIEALQFLAKSHIPRKYDLEFWAYYLQTLSIKIIVGYFWQN